MQMWWIHLKMLFSPLSVCLCIVMYSNLCLNRPTDARNENENGRNFVANSHSHDMHTHLFPSQFGTLVLVNANQWLWTIIELMLKQQRKKIESKWEQKKDHTHTHHHHQTNTQLSNYKQTAARRAGVWETKQKEDNLSPHLLQQPSTSTNYRLLLLLLFVF